MPSDYSKYRLVTVDPGLRGCGVAVFNKGVLLEAQYVKNPNEKDRGPVAHAMMAEAILKQLPNGYEYMAMAVEFPRIYPGLSDIDLNDLLDVAGVASAFVSAAAWYPDSSLMLGSARFVYPSEWKGTIKKKIMTERIQNSLTESERGLIKSVGSKDHNTIDAVGIGLHFLGRLNKKVYA